MGTLIGEARGVYPVAVEVFLDGYSGPYRHIAPLIWKSGWLRVSEVELETPYKTWRSQLVACVTDHGETVPAYIASRMFEMPASAPKEVEHTPPDELDEITEKLYWDFLGRCDRLALSELDERTAAAEKTIKSFERRGERIAAAAEQKIRTLRQKLRAFSGASDPAVLRDTIKRLDVMLERIPAALSARIAAVRQTVSEMEASVTESLGLEGEVQELFSVYWVTRPRWRGRRLDRAPEVVEAPYSAWAAHSMSRGKNEAPGREEEAEPVADEEHPASGGDAPHLENRETPYKEPSLRWALSRNAVAAAKAGNGGSTVDEDGDDTPFDYAAFQQLLNRDAERELKAAHLLRSVGPLDE